MTFGRVAEALPRAIRLVGWPKLVIFFFFFFWIRTIDRLQLYCDVCIVDGCVMCVMYAVIMIASMRAVIIGDLHNMVHNR